MTNTAQTNPVRTNPAQTNPVRTNPVRTNTARIKTARPVAAALLACVFLTSWAQPARDPFAAGDETAHSGSLRGYAVDDYEVHGILIMQNAPQRAPQSALAALRTPAGDFRVVRAGDTIGRDEVEVVKITADGVVVRTASGERRLPDVF